MDKSETTRQIKKLKVKKAQTLGELTRLREMLKAELDPDLEEGDPILVEREKALALAQVLEQRLISIDHALQQAQHQRYGVCEACGQPIDPARLEAVPETTLCLQCKMMTEQGIHA